MSNRTLLPGARFRVIVQDRRGTKLAMPRQLIRYRAKCSSIIYPLQTYVSAIPTARSEVNRVFGQWLMCLEKLR